MATSFEITGLKETLQVFQDLESDFHFGMSFR